jgi:hypothetical protein
MIITRSSFSSPITNTDVLLRQIPDKGHGTVFAGDEVNSHPGDVSKWEKLMIVRWVMLVALLILLAGCGQAPAVGDGAAAVGETVQGLLENQFAEIETAVQANDIEAARTAFTEFQTAYEGVATSVEAAAPEVGERISTAMTDLEATFEAGTPDMTAVNQGLSTLRQELEALAGGE